MIDENLPTFFTKHSNDKSKTSDTIYLTQYGSEPDPIYSLRHPDPSSPDAKNRYAVALYDSHNPEILFGEVLLIPEWTQPNPSPEAIRLNGGVPPPPEPILPTDFTVQLYNPDQQVVVSRNSGSWNTAPYWEFDMPQQTFRQPSTSALDRTQNDPAALETTPKVNFKWQKDGRLGKDLVCKLSGKATNPDGSKKKNKEPDITVAMFKHHRELTLYEPNLYRVDMEDPKGLEVVLLIGAMVIRDVYFGQMRQTFNISETSRRNSNEGRKPTPSLVAPADSPVSPQRHTSPQNARRRQDHATTSPKKESRPPPTDPRSQWEIDAETARLRKQAETERRERERRDAAEAKRVQKMLETEEKERRRRQEEIDKETKRLQRIYGVQQQEHMLRPNLPPRHNAPQRHSAPQTPAHHSQSYWQQQPGPYGPHLGVPGQQRPSTSSFFSGSAGSHPSGPRLKEKRSFFGIKKEVVNDGGRLTKKKSSMF